MLSCDFLELQKRSGMGQTITCTMVLQYSHLFSINWCRIHDFPVPALPITRNLNRKSIKDRHLMSNAGSLDITDLYHITMSFIWHENRYSTTMEETQSMHINTLLGKWLNMSTRINCLVRKDAELIALSNCYLKISKCDMLENFENIKIFTNFEISEIRRTLLERMIDVKYMLKFLSHYISNWLG